MSTREERLVDAARWMLRFLTHKDFGSQTRILLSRRVYDCLMDYEDFEPAHDDDRADWRKRREAVK